jgi:hypothetical protein
MDRLTSAGLFDDQHNARSSAAQTVMHADPGPLQNGGYFLVTGMATDQGA